MNAEQKNLIERLNADFLREFRKREAEDGICCDPGDCFVCDEDREPLPVVSIFGDIPQPITPRSKYDEATASTTQDEE
jgi:hypothetical protein